MALSCNGSGVACAKQTPFPDGFPRPAAGGFNCGLPEPGCTAPPKPTVVVAGLNDEGSPPSFDSSRLASEASTVIAARDTSPRSHDSVAASLGTWTSHGSRTVYSVQLAPRWCD